jgi:hypothetical protein
MRRFYGDVLLHTAKLCAALEKLEAIPPFGKKTFDSMRDTLQHLVKELAWECKEVEFRLSASQADRILKRMAIPGITLEEMTRMLADFSRRIQDEMQLTLLLYVPSEKAKFYNKKKLFGLDFSAKLPEATFDLDEAAKCLALDRSTACVFHLMRIMECGLGKLSGALQTTVDPERNWNPILDAINSAIKALPDHPPDAKRRKEKLSGVSSHLSNIKFAWRNPTMHVRGKYTPEEAEDIFNHVRAFMKQLLTVI